MLKAATIVRRKAPAVAHQLLRGLWPDCLVSQKASVCKAAVSSGATSDHSPVGVWSSNERGDNSFKRRG